MSDTTTRGIRVQVRTQYLAERSSPRDNQYLFAYHIRIANEGDETAQLVSREWVINDADGHIERVQGPGVVGETPPPLDPDRGPQPDTRLGAPPLPDPPMPGPGPDIPPRGP